MTTYYVDFDTGSDTLNDGLSTSAPWKHTPGDANAGGSGAGTPNGTTLVAGDIVVFKKGVTYLGQINQTGDLGSGGTLLKASTDGAGDASITSGGVLTSASGGFVAAGVQAGDYIYIYHSKASVTNTWVESCGLWAIASRDSATQLTLTGFDGVAHSTAEMTYRIIRPIIFKSLSSWGSGEATISGGNSRAGAFNLGTINRIRIEDLKIYDTNNYGVFYNGMDIHIVNCRFDVIDAGLGAPCASDINVSTGYGKYQVISGNTVTNTGTFVYTQNYYSLIENNSVTGSESPSTSRGIDNVDAYIIIRYNDLVGIDGNFGGNHGDSIGPIDQGSSNDREYQWIYGNYFYDGVIHMALYGVSGVPQYMVVHSNVFRSDSEADCNACIDHQGMSNCFFLNNTFFSPTHHPGDYAFYTRDDTPTNITFKNNIYCAPDNSTGGYAVRFDINGTGHVFDTNHYYSVSNTTPFYRSGDRTLAQWRSVYSYDLNSHGDLTTDPLFVSSIDPHLQSGSPCRTANGAISTDLSAYFTLDKDKVVRSSWDIGAYEYQGSESTMSPRGTPSSEPYRIGPRMRFQNIRKIHPKY